MLCLINNWTTLSRAAEFKNCDPGKEPKIVPGTVTVISQVLLQLSAWVENVEPGVKEWMSMERSENSKGK